jgi:hypothetical protein
MNDKEIVEAAVEVVKWMKEHGWYQIKLSPDRSASSYGFDDVLIKLCDAVIKKDI